MFKRLNDHVFKDKPFAAGDSLTIADFFILASITFTEVVGYEFPEDRFPNLGAWLNKLRASDWYADANKEFEQAKAAFIASKK